MEKPLVPMVLLLSLLAAGCAGFRPGPSQSPETPPRENPAKQPEAPVSGGPAGTGENLFWARVPPEAQAYLAELARAFARQDTAFLLAQGEAQFEAEVRPRYDEENYLAMLYRVGPYGEDESPAGIDRLRPAEIKGIEYTDWEERGPMLRVRGRLITAGAKIPCAILFNPRLKTPKILGAYP
ncbi:MAG: hypothetical protein LBU19_11365 [Treponema sp.]|jgi:hypothetical protein|nr:hypothetical protein [Treponema sp.]